MTVQLKSSCVQSLASLAADSSDEEEDAGVLRRWFGPAKSKAVSGYVSATVNIPLIYLLLLHNG